MPITVEKRRKNGDPKLLRYTCETCDQHRIVPNRTHKVDFEKDPDAKNWWVDAGKVYCSENCKKVRKA